MAERRVLASLESVVKRTQRNADGQELSIYLGQMSSDVAKQLTFVPVFESGNKPLLTERLGPPDGEGYQRPGSRTRMNQFAKYLREHSLAVVPPVVVSGRDQWEFEPSVEDSNYGVLHCFGEAAIIDGQHRVGGFVSLYESDEDMRSIELTMVPNLSLEEEKNLFMDINDNQKNVVAGLRAVLAENDESSVGRALHDREDSPFCGRIAIALRKPQHLFKMNTITKNVARTFAHGAFDDARLDDKVEMMIDYWTRIADAFPDEWADAERKDRKEAMEFKLLEATGVIAFSHAAGDLLAPAYEPITRTVNWDQVEDNLRRIVPTLNLRKDGQFEGLTGEVGGGKIHRRIQQVLALARNPGGDDEDEILEED
jgi:DNA sulfur modification protein DndB